MRTTILRVSVASLTLLGLTGQAFAGCANREDRMAMRVAALQQELMVAALTCHETPLYNAFVISYRGELQASDDALKSYFQHTAGVAEYHAFKTRLANEDSMRSIHDANYCYETGAAFEAARDARSLSSLVAHTPVMMDSSYASCDADMAADDMRGQRVASSPDSSSDGYDAPRRHSFMPDH
ncbi:MAG TPA: hypothetical protein VLV55_01295 [Rhizomicrobium sp.]|nr:hypothetical protein [Rhizomicrobium sp.]